MSAASAKRKPVVKPKSAPKQVAKQDVEGQPRPARKPPVRVSAAVLKKLEPMLALPDGVQQCTALLQQLGPMQTKRSSSVAAALLAHTTAGEPVARAYLAVVAAPESANGTSPVPEADAIARFCAKLEHGRRAMVRVFAATWLRAADMRAVEDAYRNLSREIVDDAELIAAGVEAAKRLGNKAAAAEREARLERARRLAPLLRDLALSPTEASAKARAEALARELSRDPVADAPPDRPSTQRLPAARVRAMSELATLSDDDRRYVYASVVSAQAKYGDELAATAVAASVDDPAASDMSLSAAIGAMAVSAHDELVEIWRKRVIANDEPLITRLLALFEWTGLSASDAAQFEPYIRALHPAGGRRDVFAQVDGALASERAVVRAAVLDGWLQHAERIAAFDAKQIANLLRSVIAIAEAGNDTVDRKAATRALAGVGSHPAVRDIVIAAIRAPSPRRNPDMRPSLYHGLAASRLPANVPFLVERLFVEREAYDALLDALARDFDLDTHRRVLATLSERAQDPGAVHAATLYAELLLERLASPRLVIELARAIASWQTRNNDDARRLRYVLERGIAAALATRRESDAATLLARARQLPDRPYSDYRVIAHASETPSPLADPAVAARVAALDSGDYAKELAAADAAIAEARAAKKPKPADDDKLAALAGSAVASRLLDDRDRGVAWFFDELGELHVYDGFTVVPRPFQVHGLRRDGIAPEEMQALMKGSTIVDERLTLFDAARGHVRELIRFGDRILLFDGQGSGTEPISVRALGFKLSSYVGARDTLRRFEAAAPKGTRRVDGVVRREYELRGANAKLAAIKSSIYGTVDAGFPPLGREHADAKAAQQALLAWEVKVFAAGGKIVRIAPRSAAE